MKRGFTLIELITTFALAAVIIVILINIIIQIKEVYIASSVETELYLNQSNLSVALRSKLNLVSYTTCNDSSFCYELLFNDGETKKLIVNNNKIQYGNYTYVLDKGSNIDIDKCIFTTETITTTDVNIDNSFLILKIPITNKTFPDEDFGINLVYLYNSN